MAKLSLNSFISLSRRLFSVAATTENYGKSSPSVVCVARKISDYGASRTGTPAQSSKEDFWMRDPKTGNWIPESHFGEIDVAELREKLLSKK
uniref:Uncharacterized protein n=1 Tax=Nelumbo nucifera TaxID=4432 RepID=A0A823A5Z1_NELNU|nr:TPA_asm: hypothetical protein HUJ06_019125 [Nelumbo nucifera]